MISLRWMRRFQMSTYHRKRLQQSRPISISGFIIHDTCKTARFDSRRWGSLTLCDLIGRSRILPEFSGSSVPTHFSPDMVLILRLCRATYFSMPPTRQEDTKPTWFIVFLLVITLLSWLCSSFPTVSIQFRQHSRPPEFPLEWSRVSKQLSMSLGAALIVQYSRGEPLRP